MESPPGTREIAYIAIGLIMAKAKIKERISFLKSIETSL